MSYGFELLDLSWILLSFRLIFNNNNIIILFCFTKVKSVLLTGFSELRPSGILWKIFASSNILRYV